MTYAVHISAGSLGIISGFIALYAAKGAGLHRKSGMVFVYAMLTMAFFGLVISAVRGVAPAVNIPAALLTAYLVVTALTTVRPLSKGARALHVGAMLVALVVTLTDLTFAFQAITSATGRSHGFPAFPYVLFAVAGVSGTAGDMRIIRSGEPRGSARLARHLWRMCFALFIAALSFFIGQAKVFPKPVRIPALLGLPVLAVLATMLYWLWRVRVRHSLRGIVVMRAPDASISTR